MSSRPFALFAPVLLLFAACAHDSKHETPLTTAISEDTPRHLSPDGQWAVASLWDNPDNTGKRWDGIMEKSTGRRVFTVSEYNPKKPYDSEGQLMDAKWSRDSQLLAVSVRHGHWNDGLLVVKHTGSSWTPIPVETPHFKGWQSALDVPRGHHTSQGGSWIAEVKWKPNGVLQVEYETQVSDQDANSNEAETNRYLEDADYRFTDSRSQVRWHSR